jgi:hypothetical protein
VEAVVTRPLFSTDHRLLIPEGSRLLGDVVEARPARRLHRNGKLLFVFRQIKLPGNMQSIQGYLEGVEADFAKHLALDSEGATRARSPKTRFIFPAIAVAVAGLSFHQDYNAQGVPDQDIGGRAESGAVGLGLIGTLLAQASRTLASSIAIAGAGFSVYSTFIARGEDVVLPAKMRVSVTQRRDPCGGRPPLSRRGGPQSGFALGGEVAIWTSGRGKRLDSGRALYLRRELPIPWLALPVAVAAVGNPLLQRFTGAFSDRHALGILLTLDTLCLTALLSLTGGPANPFTLLYLVQITLSAVILSKEWTWAIGGLSVACFAFLFPVHVRCAVFEVITHPRGSRSTWLECGLRLPPRPW